MSIWEKIEILTQNKILVNGIAPEIISASRATDIPAFYSKWFFQRLKIGYLIWYNPFNFKPIYVSFKNVKFIVFWSKNPISIFKYLNILDKAGIGYYFHFTLNDYENEKFEPLLPSLDKRIEAFINLSKMIGRDKVIWRFDPIILTENLSSEKIIKRIEYIGNKIEKFTKKLVISFVDIDNYKMVKYRLNKVGVKYYCFDQVRMEEIAELLNYVRYKNGWEFEIAACSESIDLSKFNIYKNRCIDPVLIRRILDNKGIEINFKKFGEKDKGQRIYCNCTYSKDIGQYNTCPHLCIYCYANFNKTHVIKNYRNHISSNESIID